MNQALMDYLLLLQVRGLGHSRRDHMRRTVERLIVYLGQRSDIRAWREVTEADLLAFLAQASQTITYRGKLPSRYTVQQWASCLCAFFRWQQSSGRLLANPAHYLSVPLGERPMPHVLTEREIARLIEMPNLTTPHGCRDRAIMEVLYASGIRLNEAHQLDLYDVDCVSGQLLVREGKGMRARYLPLTEQACHWLAQYLQEARPLLAVGLKGRKKPIAPSIALWLAVEGRRLSATMIEQNLNRYALAAQLKATPHSFRHAFASHLLRNGATAEQLKQLLGHQSLAATQYYLHINDTDLRSLIKRVAGK